MARSDLTNSAVRHQIMLERLKSAEAREFNKLVPILERQVRETLAKLGEPVQSLTRARLNGLLRELRAAQAAALEEAQDKLLKRLRNIAAYETRFEAESLTAQTPTGVTLTASTTQAARASPQSAVAGKSGGVTGRVE